MDSLKSPENLPSHRTPLYAYDLNKKPAVNNNSVAATNSSSPTSSCHSFKDDLNNSSLSSSSVSLSSSSCSSLNGSTCSLNSTTWSSMLYLPSLYPHLFAEPTSANVVTPKCENTDSAPPFSFSNKNQIHNLNLLNSLMNVYGHLNNDHAKWLREQNIKLQQLRRVQSNFEQLDNKTLPNNVLLQRYQQQQQLQQLQVESDANEFSLSFDEINKKVNDLISTDADEVELNDCSSRSSSVSEDKKKAFDDSDDYLSNLEMSELNEMSNSMSEDSSLSDSSSRSRSFFFFVLYNGCNIKNVAFLFCL